MTEFTPFLPQWQAFRLSALLDSGHLSSLSQFSLSSPFGSSRSSLVVLAISCHSYQDLEHLSKRYHHFSSTHISTIPLHLLLLTSIYVFFNPHMFVCSLVFLSTTFRPHMALTKALSVPLKTQFLFSFKHHVLLPYSIADLMQQ